MSILNAALRYAEMGLSIFPCKPTDKKPYVGWAEFQTRRASADEIRAWWQKWPRAMIGIVTGEISNLFVVDCDNPAAYETIQKLLPDSLMLPTARTPRTEGGWHLYFAHPKGCNTTIKAGVLSGVDYRGNGGYVIAPPSINGNERAYAWQEGLALGEVAPPPLPGGLQAALKVNNKFYMEGCGQNENQRPQETTKTTSDHSFFHQGSRDNDLFHAANCLIKGGCAINFTKQVLDILARNSIPPFPVDEIKAKIDSAIKRAEARERNLAAEIRGWCETTNGHFMTTDCHKELQLTTKDHMKAANMALLRLCEGANPLLEKYGGKRGCYRRIENDVEEVDFLNAPTEDFPLALPLGIDSYCKLYPGNIVVVAGSKSAGKTAFLLNIVKDNMRQHEVVYLNSEMGDTEFRKRLELFEMPLKDWNFHAYNRTSNFADLITPEKKIFIVDFLEVTTDFWKVAQYIHDIHKKLKEGLCIIALQKSDGKDAGRGGDFSKEKARLYIALDYLPDERTNRVKIVDAKAWRMNINPRGKYRNYKLIKGAKFITDGDWME